MSDPLQRFLEEQVILDTTTPIVYIGKLVEVTDRAFVLVDTDMHDCREGHAGKELYLAEASRDGVTVNRRKVIVSRFAVISVSRLADVVTE
ncbi:MAG: hypothetical protein PVI86_06785 [Phycisphaerae bacterium]|jgi:hypothetical protein